MLTQNKSLNEYQNDFLLNFPVRPKGSYAPEMNVPFLLPNSSFRTYSAP